MGWRLMRSLYLGYKYLNHDYFFRQNALFRLMKKANIKAKESQKLSEEFLHDAVLALTGTQRNLLENLSENKVEMVDSFKDLMHEYKGLKHVTSPKDSYLKLHSARAALRRAEQAPVRKAIKDRLALVKANAYLKARLTEAESKVHKIMGLLKDEEYEKKLLSHVSSLQEIRMLEDVGIAWTDPATDNSELLTKEEVERRIQNDLQRYRDFCERFERGEKIKKSEFEELNSLGSNLTDIKRYHEQRAAFYENALREEERRIFSMGPLDVLRRAREIGDGMVSGKRLPTTELDFMDSFDTRLLDVKPKFEHGRDPYESNKGNQTNPSNSHRYS